MAKSLGEMLVIELLDTDEFGVQKLYLGEIK